MTPSPLFESKDDVVAFSMRLATRAIGKRIVYEERVASTNDLALAAARGDGDESNLSGRAVPALSDLNRLPEGRDGPPTCGAHGTIFVAEAQDAGRGRLGRKWEA